MDTENICKRRGNMYNPRLYEMAYVERKVVENLHLELVELKLSENRFMKWFQKLLVKLLNKSGAHRIEKQTSIQEFAIDKQEMEKTINAQMKELRNSYLKPGEVYMGLEDFSRLTHKTLETWPHAFQFDYRTDGGRYGEKGTVYGMTVFVLPWMKGTLVTPSGKAS